MKHYLLDIDLNIFFKVEQFDSQAIKAKIAERLTTNPDDFIEHCKCASNDFDYFKAESLNFYQCNKSGQPCLVVTKGNREYLKALG